jgi:sigma-E factor negative regulatory protein RseC
MREQGVVSRIVSPGIVEVVFRTSEACKGCCACHRDAEGKASLDAAAFAGVKTGDLVEVEIPTGEVVTASFVVYLLPVLSLIAGYLVGSALAGLFHGRFSGETVGMVCAFIFFAFSFLGVRWYDGHILRKGTLQARVTGILESQAELRNSGILKL